VPSAATLTGTIALLKIDWFETLAIAGLAGAGAAAIRLYVDGLWRKYPALFFYLILSVLYGLPQIFIEIRSQLYEKIYICEQPLIWMLFVLMVREVYALALASHRGLRSLSRWAMYVAVTISVTFSMLSILKKITPKTPQLSRLLGYVFAVDRGVNFALVLFILVILFFLSRYPIPLSRNVVRHTSFLFIYFLSNASVILLRTIYGVHANQQLSTAITAVGDMMVFGWLFFLTPAGESTRKVVGISAEHEEHILRQLDALNATLLKIARN
jgi:hypothetical protein